MIAVCTTCDRIEAMAACPAALTYRSDSSLIELWTIMPLATKLCQGPLTSMS